MVKQPLHWSDANHIKCALTSLTNYPLMDQLVTFGRPLVIVGTPPMILEKKNKGLRKDMASRFLLPKFS